MSDIPDNYELFQRHDDEAEAILEELPVCCCCGNHIQDDCYYDIDGEIYCEKCMEDTFRRFI
ncbi:hypothetical protein ACQRCQ_03330 [Lachnospiraceae bacterium SGI.085]